jgi:spermidine synthase
MPEQKERQIPGFRFLGAPSLIAVILSLIGVTAVVAQVVLMRELIVVFYGNEISLGLTLANWLLWTAMGSSLLGRIATKARDARRLMAGLQVAIAVAFPLTIYAVRASKAVLQTTPGELLGPWPMFLTSLATLSVFCLISGCLFAAGSRLYGDTVGASVAAATGAVYLLEAVGSGLGGLIAGLALIQHLGSFQIALLVALANLLAASSLAVCARPLRRAIMAGLLAAFAFLILPFGSRWLETVSLAELWKGFRLAAVRNSQYGNLAVVETEGSRSIYENGLVVSTVPDPAAAEEAVHYALLQHPSPRRLLLIGGGLNGSILQALEHPSLERIDYVELDPTILDLAGQYFATEWAGVLSDPRVHIHHADGRLFLKTTDSTFDVIIVNLPDPQTAQLNRFYTVEFYREAASRLAPGGVFSFQVTGAENYISPELADFLRCLNRTLREVFPEVSAMPGETVHFFAATSRGVLAAGPEALLERLHARKIQTSYVREYYIPFRMSADRVADLQLQIEPQADTPVNRDFAPVAYYFDVTLWSARFHRATARYFGALAAIDFWKVLAGVAVGLAALSGILLSVVAVYDRRRELLSVAPGLSPTDAVPGRGGQVPAAATRRRITAGFCVAAMGFTLIGLEVLLLLGFQAIYGYVYHQLAIMIATFMVGMAAGAWLASRGPGESPTSAPSALAARSEMGKLAALQAVAAVAPLLLYALFTAFARVTSPSGLFAVSQIIFPALALVSGMLGGYQFPLASRVYFAGREDSPRSPGTLYGLDLLGACAGALVLSVYLFPVFGFLRAALLMGVVNLAPTVLAALPVASKEIPQG